MASVLKISEAAALALHTMVYLAEKEGNQVSTKEIANAISRSEFHLSKVLQRLARAGLVQSVRGPRGGFVLSDKGPQVSLLEIYEAIEGPVDMNPCILGSPMCCRTSCIMGNLVQSVNQQFQEYMGSTKLVDLLEEEDGKRKTSFQ
jgi:Rrf2 family protein